MSQFLVAGAARSGTKYISEVFTKLGIRCGHERIFCPNNVRTLEKVVKNKGVIKKWKLSQMEMCGESSWLSIPFLPTIDKNITVLHQTRNPINCVQSLTGIALFKFGQRKGDGPLSVYFIKRYYPEIYEHGTEIDRAFQYWVTWNKQIEENAFVPMRYKLEDIGVETIRKLTNYIGCPKRSNQIEGVLESVRKDTNKGKWREAPGTLVQQLKSIGINDIKSEQLREEVIKLANNYNYSLTDNKQ